MKTAQTSKINVKIKKKIKILNKKIKIRFFDLFLLYNNDNNKRRLKQRIA